jgi:hypothetical protein
MSAINNRPILDLRTDWPVSHALDLTGLTRPQGVYSQGNWLALDRLRSS